MSLILEALKKSEARRQLGEAPGIGTPFTVAPRRRSLLPMLVALIVLAGGLGWYFLLRSPPAASDPGRSSASAGQTIALTAPVPAAAPQAGAAPTRAAGAANRADVANGAAAGDAARASAGARAGDGPGALQPFHATQPPAATPGGVNAAVPASPGASPDPARGRFAGIQGNAAQRAVDAARASQPPGGEQPGSLQQRAMQARDPRARVPGSPATPPQPANTAGAVSPAATRNVAGTVAAATPAGIARTQAPAMPSATPGVAAAPSRPPAAATAPATAMHPADSSAAAAPASTPAPPPGTPKAPGAPLASDVPLYYELPFNVRKDLPNLTISMHVYAAAADQRFVMIDGERRAEGDTFKDVTLREIRPDGMVLEFRGQRFFYPRTGH